MYLFKNGVIFMSSSKAYVMYSVFQLLLHDVPPTQCVVWGMHASVAVRSTVLLCVTSALCVCVMQRSWVIVCMTCDNRSYLHLCLNSHYCITILTLTFCLWISIILLFFNDVTVNERKTLKWFQRQTVNPADRWPGELGTVQWETM